MSAVRGEVVAVVAVVVVLFQSSGTHVNIKRLLLSNSTVKQITCIQEITLEH